MKEKNTAHKAEKEHIFLIIYSSKHWFYNPNESEE